MAALKGEFPRSKIEMFFRRAAPELRVSEDARDALLDVLEILGVEIARQAIAYSVLEKRKSVSASDIRKAVKELWG